MLHRESAAAEVGIKEIREGRDVVFLLHAADSLEGIWRHKEDRGRYGKTSELGVCKHTNRHNITALEGMAGHKRWVRVI